MKRALPLVLTGAVVMLAWLPGCKKSSSGPEITGIVVTLKPQAGTNIDVNNARVQVYSDAGFQNLVTEKAALGSATQASCTLQVAPGTFYVAAWKDMDNSGSVSSGDFWGAHANDLGQPLGVTVASGELKTVTFTIGIYSGSGGGGGGGGGGGTGATISGTAVLASGTPADIAGAYAFLYTSTADWQNGNYAYNQTVQGSGTQATFSFSGIPAGTYYLEIFKDNGDGQWGTSGDLIGEYDDQDLTDGIQLTPITVSDGQTFQAQVTVFMVQ